MPEREPELFLLFVRPLDRAGIRYVVTGSWSITAKAVPKSTCVTFAPCSPYPANNWIGQCSMNSYNSEDCKQSGNWFPVEHARFYGAKMVRLAALF